jgi:2,5-diamino-6-(ribosylamino)-4(3H)-pyrimidinone 5'-phosphate reductase
VAEPGATERAVRPAVWLNCAASADGRLAFAGGRRARLSSPEDLRRVQQLRENADAILVGVGTVVHDDPSLRVHWELLGKPEGNSPTRVVVDASGRTPEHARVLDGSVRTIVATSERCRRKFPPTVEVEVAGAEEVDLARLFVRLHERGIRRLMVEGGATILASVLRERLFDRFTVYYAPRVIGGSSAPPIAGGPDPSVPETVTALRLVALDRLGEGYVVTYAPVPPGAPVKPDGDSPPPEAPG